MNPRNTLTLAAIAVLLGAYVYALWMAPYPAPEWEEPECVCVTPR